jgi:hypothetical protein
MTLWIQHRIKLLATQVKLFLASSPSPLFQERKGGWPKCAYFIHGLGRFMLDDVSETPLKIPYNPLGTFIAKVSYGGKGGGQWQ